MPDKSRQKLRLYILFLISLTEPVLVIHFPKPTGMKTTYTLFLIILFGITAQLTVDAQSFQAFLSSRPGIVAAEKLEGDSPFREVWALKIRQPLDHTDTSTGYFTQRVFIALRDSTRPVVFVTEGYVGDYAANPAYQEELSRYLDASQVFVEHRYFSGSVPDSLDWQYLTVANAAADHHAVHELLDDYFAGKWIATGISKGGQTALYYLALYPGDADITVPYVAPMNRSVEDGRHEPFIGEQVSTAENRERVKQFQTEVLKRRDRLMPWFQEYLDTNHLEYRISPDAVYDYSVLEYSFSFWQWGVPVDRIPAPDAPDSLVYRHFMQVSDPSYFAVNGMEAIRPFFVQAAAELGYYGYDTEPFDSLLTLDDASNYLEEVMLPEGLTFDFIPETNQKVFNYIRDHDPQVILIYGEYDPWSASGIFFEEKENMLKIVKPGGSHGTRIGNLPDSLQQVVLERLEVWLKE